MNEEKVYTKQDVLKSIEAAYWAGVNAGSVEYGSEYFSAEGYLPEQIP